MGNRLDAMEKGKVDARGEPVNVDVDGVQVLAVLDEMGREVGDPTPMAPPIHLTRPVTLAERIRSMVSRELSMRAQEGGYESFAESDDFDIDDDPSDPHTPYEAVFDPLPPQPEVKNGRTAVDEGRGVLVADGSGKSRTVVEDKPEPQSDVQRGRSKADRGDPSPNE